MARPTELTESQSHQQHIILSSDMFNVAQLAQVFSPHKNTKSLLLNDIEFYIAGNTTLLDHTIIVPKNHKCKNLTFTL